MMEQIVMGFVSQTISTITVNGLIVGRDREIAKSIIIENHYTRSVPSGKSHYCRFEDAIVVWSIPANKNVAKFILGWNGCVWELSRLYAPDGHEPNLLTRAISFAVSIIKQLEHPDALVSYADPSAGHKGGVYRAASWTYDGRSEEVRMYAKDGNLIPRRSFHSGRSAMTKKEIESLGFEEIKAPGKERFIKLLSRKAKKSRRQ